MAKPDTLMVDDVKYVREDSILKPGKTAPVKNVQKHPYTIGKQWFFMTATFFFAGNVTAVTETEIVLEKAAWIPETGRFNEFIRTGTPKEAEPCGTVVLSRGGIIAAFPDTKTQTEVIR